MKYILGLILILVTPLLFYLNYLFFFGILIWLGLFIWYCSRKDVNWILKVSVLILAIAVMKIYWDYN